MAAWGLISPIVENVTGLVKTVFGSRQERDSYAHAENTASLEQYSAEFVSRPERNTWFDSLVDGLNRLQRPTYTFSTLALFWMAYKNPVEFARIMQGLALIPEQFWIIVGMIVGFLFSSRMIEQLPIAKAFKGISKDEVRLISATAKDLQAQRVEEEKQRPLENVEGLPWVNENPAIEAWKRAKTRQPS